MYQVTPSSKTRTKPNKKLKATKVARPYRGTATSKPVAEDTQLASKVFGNTYEMILAAGFRAVEIANGKPTDIVGHTPIVSAMLEVQQGKIDRAYWLEQVDKRARERAKAKMMR